MRICGRPVEELRACPAVAVAVGTVSLALVHFLFLVFVQAQGFQVDRAAFSSLIGNAFHISDLSFISL